MLLPWIEVFHQAVFLGCVEAASGMKSKRCQRSGLVHVHAMWITGLARSHLCYTGLKQWSAVNCEASG
jgi:hypothetical protein